MLEKILRQLHNCGENQLPFDLWWNQWKDTKEFKSALEDFLKESSDKDFKPKETPQPLKNVIIGGTIITQGSLHIGDK